MRINGGLLSHSDSEWLETNKNKKDMNDKDLRIIENAIADIERWKGMAYKEGDEVGNAIEEIKEVLKKYGPIKKSW